MAQRPFTAIAAGWSGSSRICGRAAGWGIVDSLGVPKAAYYYLNAPGRAGRSRITDEGLDGLHLHVINETADSFRGFVELLLLKDEHVVVARREVACEMGPRHQAGV